MGWGFGWGSGLGREGAPWFGWGGWGSGLGWGLGVGLGGEGAPAGVRQEGGHVLHDVQAGRGASWVRARARAGVKAQQAWVKARVRVRATG